MKIIHPEILQQKLDNCGFILLTPYTTTTIISDIKCIKCGFVNQSSLNIVLAGHYTCKQCGHYSGQKISNNPDTFDFIGVKIGKLTVIDKDISKNGRRWLCQCDCGNITTITTSALNSKTKKSCGCLKRFNYIGEKYFYLTILEHGMYIDNKKYHSQYAKCRCDCGKITTVCLCRLRRGDIRSCGCIKGIAKRKSFGEASRNAVYKKYIKESQRRNILFLLTYEQCINFFEGNCYYCNKPPSNLYHEKNCFGAYKYNGIDRLNNNDCYRIDNCVSCCKICNFKKSSDSEEDFLKWIELVYNFKIKSHI
jgi:hypothetical protein